jgi:hypothetical protein
MLKSKRLTVKVLPSDKGAIEQIAQAEGEPVAVVVRRLIRQEAQRRGLLNTSPATAPGQEERMNDAERIQNV